MGPTLPRDPDIPGMLARWPMVAVAIALIFGIALHTFLPIQVPLWIGIGASLVVGSLIARRSDMISTGALLAGAIFLGLSLGQLRAFFFRADEIGLFAGDSRRLAELEIEIVDPPRIFTPSFGQVHSLPSRQTTLAQVRAIKTWTGWQTATGRLLVQISEPNASLAVGQTVRVLGLLERPAPAMNPGQMDWASYYRDLDVLTSLHVARAKSLHIIPEKSHDPTLLQSWRAWTRDKLADGFTDRQSLDQALLRALVLGDSDPELRDVQEKFRKTGTSHHLAISGMHVAVMGGVIFLIARLLRLRPRWAWTVALIFVFAYGMAALPSPPVVRSILLWLIVGFAVLMRRRFNLLHMLATVLVAMLIYHPMDLYNAGFQLSFGCVLGLIVLTPALIWLLGGARDETVALMEPDLTMSVVEKVGQWVDSKLLMMLASGVVAWLVSMPIIAVHFDQMNPWAILASIVLAPFVLMSLVSGVFKILLTAIWPSGAGFWAWLAQQPTMWMRKVVEWLTHLPKGDVPLPTPPWWVTVIFYLSIIAFVIRWNRTSVRWLARLSPLMAIGLLLFAPYQTTITASQSGDALRVTLLSVGAGQAAVVEPPSHRVFVIDAGSMSMADPLRKCIAPFLRQRGITAIDSIAISHANTDHYGAVADLVEGYDVHEVLVASGFADSVQTSASGVELLSDLDRAQRPPRQVKIDDVIPIAQDAHLRILWPPVDCAFSDNDKSLVIRLQYKDRSILFTGDIEDDAMRELLKRPDDLKSDVLIAPHHGSSESLTSAFLQAVAPQSIVASNDRTLSRKQLDFDVIARNYPLHRTHDRGAITIDLNADGQIQIQCANEP